jgi:hypothetical protein
VAQPKGPSRRGPTKRAQIERAYKKKKWAMPPIGDIAQMKARANIRSNEMNNFGDVTAKEPGRRRRAE